MQGRACAYVYKMLGDWGAVMWRVALAIVLASSPLMPAAGVEQPSERGGVSLESRSSLQAESPRRQERASIALIRDIQQALASSGYDPGPIDGILGRRTEAAIRAFQSDSGHQMTGVATGELLEEILSRVDRQPVRQDEHPDEVRLVPVRRWNEVVEASALHVRPHPHSTVLANLEAGDDIYVLASVESTEWLEVRARDSAGRAVRGYMRIAALTEPLRGTDVAGHGRASEPAERSETVKPSGMSSVSPGENLPKGAVAVKPGEAAISLRDVAAFQGQEPIVIRFGFLHVIEIARWPPAAPRGATAELTLLYMEPRSSRQPESLTMWSLPRPDKNVAEELLDQLPEVALTGQEGALGTQKYQRFALDTDTHCVYFRQLPGFFETYNFTLRGSYCAAAGSPLGEKDVLQFLRGVGIDLDKLKDLPEWFSLPK